MQMTQNTMMTMNYSKHNSNNVNIIQNDLLIDSHFTSRQQNLSLVSLLDLVLELLPPSLRLILLLMLLPPPNALLDMSNTNTRGKK